MSTDPTGSLNKIVAETAASLENFNQNLIEKGVPTNKEIQNVVKQLNKSISKMESPKGPLSITATRKTIEEKRVQQVEERVKNKMLSAVIFLLRYEKSVIHDVGTQAGLWGLLRTAKKRIKGLPVKRKKAKIEKADKTHEPR
jgi:hypothetical protein